MIALGDRRGLVVQLLVAELLARPGRPGPLARPRWPRMPNAMPSAPATATPAATTSAPAGGGQGEAR
jgi:hypothetical protein